MYSLPATPLSEKQRVQKGRKTLEGSGKYKRQEYDKERKIRRQFERDYRKQNHEYRQPKRFVWVGIPF